MKALAGTFPKLPWPFHRWTWLTEPIPAERLAAWRVGTGLILLLDAFLFYIPIFDILYGPLAQPDVFADRFDWPRWNWSIFSYVPSSWGPTAGMWVWIIAAVLLTIGWRPRWMALILWTLSLSFYNTSYYLHNSGDRIRHFLCLILIFAPTDAAWAIRRRPREGGPFNVSAWPARLLLIQMTVMYFMNGFWKLQGRMWWEGSVMWYVNHDLAWARWSSPNLPYWSTQMLTWGALIWEVGFPLWITWRPTRIPALIIGVIFHVVTFFHLEIAAFPLYALCLYLPLAPWERCRSGFPAGQSNVDPAVQPNVPISAE